MAGDPIAFRACLPPDFKTALTVTGGGDAQLRFDLDMTEVPALMAEWDRLLLVAIVPEGEHPQPAPRPGGPGGGWRKRSRPRSKTESG